MTTTTVLTTDRSALDPSTTLRAASSPAARGVAAAGAQLGQAGAGDLDRARRPEHHLGLAAVEGDQRHLAPPAVGVAEQAEHGRLGRGHPPLDAHRGRSVDDEHHQAGDALLALGAAQVVDGQTAGLVG